jgi:serine/threonine-protein kinase
MEVNRSEARIDELLLRWAELRARGGSITAEQLAADSPELADELARRISAIRSTEDSPERTRSYGQTPPFPSGLHVPATALSPGGGLTMVGRLVDARFHARGGLGEVFVARQDELDRPVALKRIRPDQFHEAARVRFVREASITARLQHPGIVPIHGLGEDEDGPFYTMPFIRGTTLQEAIREIHRDEALEHDPGRRSLALRDLLRRFISVCETMAYAHDQAVVHRDLKPANIMLGPYGETLVMDWGLAKRYLRDTDSDDPGTGSGPSPDDMTAAGTVLGTPLYMSPEQASGKPAGPASDLYSLGAILYAILTSQSPYLESPPADPLRPMREAAVVPPRQRDPSIARPLEAICLKAMAARPKDRYPSASKLAEDVARWLADEPVSAYREGPSARLARWARRHRASVQAASLALVVVAILATTAAVVVDRARRREEAARSRVTLALASESAAKAEAQENLGLAARAVNDYFTKISENALLKRQDAAEVRDLRSLRKELLEVALDYYNRLATRRSPGPDLRAEQAAAYKRVGRINDEIATKEAALEAFRQAAAIWAVLAAQSPDDLKLRHELALSRLELAGALAEVGRSDEALGEYARGQEVLEGLSRAHPDDPDLQSELARANNGAGIVLRSLGRMEEALAALERGWDAMRRLADGPHGDAEDRRQLATGQSNIGLLRDEIGRTDEAILALEQSRSIYEGLLAADPSNSGVQGDLAACYNNLGLVFSRGGRHVESLAALARGRPLFERLVAAHPSVQEFRRDLATNHINSGNAHSVLGHPAEALPEFERARAILQPLLDANPSDMGSRRNLAATLYNIGEALRATGKIVAALEPAEKACTLVETADERAPFDELILALAHDLSADMLGKAESPAAGDPARREAHIRRAMAALRRAIVGGYRAIDPGSFSALRDRSEFQEIMRDLTFPEWPFESELAP